MKASQLHAIAKEAKESGYNEAVKDICKKIKFASECGHFDASITLLPWYDFTDKQVEFFIRNGFKIEVGKDSVYISWSGGF